MVDDETVNYHLRRIRRVKPRYLGGAFVVSSLVSVFALRANNMHMAELRSKLQQVDEKGGDVTKPLQELQSYVLSHMNTSLATESVYPPIQLKGTYERLMAAEKARVDSANSTIYTDAQNYCETQNTDFSGRGRVPCIQQYVQDHGTKAQTIPTSLYQFDFVAPRWSSDFAGWSLVLTLLIGVALIIRLLVGVWYKKRTQ